MADEVQPVDGRAEVESVLSIMSKACSRWAGLRGVVSAELLASGIVLVIVRRERRIPDWTLVGMIFDGTFRQIHVWNCVVVGAGDGVVGVRAVCAKDDRLQSCKCWLARP